MELWIRSQDKKDLIKATSICMTKEDYDNIGIFVNGCLVGLYKSTQRALEVLDEIQQVINNNGVENEEYDKISGCYYIAKKNTYEMPKE